MLKQLRVKPLKEAGEETIDLEPGEWDESVELFIGALRNADLDVIISKEE